MARKDELRAWLGLAPADLPVWCAGICILVMNIAEDPVIDWAMAAAALILTLIACFMGMKRDKHLSDFSNAMKKITYPLCVAAVIALTYLTISPDGTES